MAGPLGKEERFPGAPQSHRAAGRGASLRHALPRTTVLNTPISVWPGVLGSPGGQEMRKGLKSGLGHQREAVVLSKEGGSNLKLFPCPPPGWPEGASAAGTAFAQGLSAQLAPPPVSCSWHTWPDGSKLVGPGTCGQRPGGLLPASGRLAGCWGTTGPLFWKVALLEGFPNF